MVKVCTVLCFFSSGISDFAAHGAEQLLQDRMSPLFLIMSRFLSLDLSGLRPKVSTDEDAAMKTLPRKHVSVFLLTVAVSKYRLSNVLCPRHLQ